MKLLTTYTFLASTFVGGGEEGDDRISGLRM